MKSESLTTNETRQLTDLETVIESGLRTFAEVGNALLSIRDSRLYREQFATFEEYCRERWGFARTYAHYMIESAKVVENIRVHHGEQTQAHKQFVDRMVEAYPNLPQSERQARPLSKLPAEEQPAAWQAATDKAAAEGRKVTAKDVEEEVEERKEKAASKEAPARQRGSYEDWRRLRELFEIVQNAVRQMGDLNVDSQHKIQARSMCEAMSVRFNKLAQKLVE